MRINLLILSILFFYSSVSAQVNNLAPNSDTIELVKKGNSTGQRRISNFDFSNRIFLCACGKRGRPIDLICFKNDIWVNGAVAFLELNVISTKYSQDTTKLQFLANETGDVLDYYNGSETARTFSFTTNKKVIIEYTNEDTLYYDLNPNRVRSEHLPIAQTDMVTGNSYDHNRRIVKKCWNDDCSVVTLYSYYGNGAVQSQEFYGLDGNESFAEVEKWDTLGNIVLYTRYENDSLVYSNYFEYVPHTDLKLTAGFLNSSAPQEVEIYYSYEYQFDSVGNWTKRASSYYGELVEIVERKILYRSDIKKIHISGGQSFEPYYSKQNSPQYISKVEFEKYAVMIDTKSNTICAISKSGKTLWTIKAKKIPNIMKANELLETTHYLGLSNIKKYDLILQLYNGQVYLINSKNGRIKSAQ